MAIAAVRRPLEPASLTGAATGGAEGGAGRAAAAGAAGGAAGVTVTWGAGSSAPEPPIQRTTEPFEYVWIALNVSLSPALPGIWTEIGKSWNWPGLMPPAALVRAKTMRSMPCVIGPSSVWMGCASFFVITRTFQPGTFWYRAAAKPSGNLTSTFAVEALSSSVGTRTLRTVNAPAGAWLGCSVTWACAAAGMARAATAVAAASLLVRDIGGLLLVLKAETDWRGGRGGGAARGGGARPPPGGA